MKKLLLFTFLLTFVLLQNATNGQEIGLSNVWKFKEGDNAQWSNPDYNDKDWKTIETGKTWDDQGYNVVGGYAWYRIKFNLSSNLTKNVIIKDSLKIFLGKIDECDQTFLNGVLIGENNGIKTKNFEEASYAWNIDREYKVSVNNPILKWDQDNVLAIRVYNSNTLGGMISGNQKIANMELMDFVHLKLLETNNTSKEKSNVMSKISISNIASNYKISGKLKIQQIQFDVKNKIINEKIIDIKIEPKSNYTVEFPYSIVDNSSIIYAFTETKTKKTISIDYEIPYILTPKPSNTPKINGAKVFGVRPGNPFLFTIPATGSQPILFSVIGLPKGLVVDKNTGIITGKISEKGEYKIKLIAENSFGKSERDFKIVCGDKISLTPPMGWNSWNCWGLSVSEEKVKSSADAMVASGLINHGWTYMNIDDGWELVHEGGGSKMLTNEKFPDMKRLADYVHSKGLKLGIYSSPGPKTCGGYEASFGYENADAQRFAEWDIDYLKYDWCSYSWIYPRPTLEELKKPYILMNKYISNVGRDIVYSLCQYGMGDVWKWGGEVGGNCWRTTGDITDTWESMFSIGFNQDKCSPYAKPGNWNDPDMLIVGKVGWGPSLHNTRLTVNEQYTHISLWSLLSSPLLIGCDLAQLDDFTIGLLSNDEVIDVNQDPLGKQAIQKIKNDQFQVWVKEMEDGSKVIGIFNISLKPVSAEISLKEITGFEKCLVRDVWRQKDLGEFTDKYVSNIPSHGVVLIKTIKK